MIGLEFACLDARPDRHAATPTLRFTVRAAETTGVRVHAIALRAAVRIEPARRDYTSREARRLRDLFGDQSQWDRALQAIGLAQVSTVVPGFTDSRDFELVVPCTYDLEVASARFLHAVEEGVVPLRLLFSGTVFSEADGGPSATGVPWVRPVPWSCECEHRLPVDVWRDTIDGHFPNSGWLRLHESTLDELGGYKSQHALPTWDATITHLLGQHTRMSPV